MSAKKPATASSTAVNEKGKGESVSTEAKPRMPWRVVLDKDLPQLTADAEVWLDTLNPAAMHSNDKVEKIEQLLRKEEYLKLAEVTDALLNSAEVRKQLSEKTVRYLNHVLRATSGPPPAQPNGHMANTLDVVPAAPTDAPGMPLQKGFSRMSIANQPGPSPLSKSGSGSKPLRTNSVPKQWTVVVKEHTLKERAHLRSLTSHIGASHVCFLGDLFDASHSLKPNQGETVGALSYEQFTEFAEPLLHAVRGCDGKREARWAMDVFVPLIRKVFNHYQLEPEAVVPLIAAPDKSFRADMVVTYRLSDANNQALDIYANAGERLEVSPQSSFVHIEFKRSSIAELTHIRKLGCQLQLNMEYQTRALAAVTGKDASSHLRLPWTVGILMDNSGVTFVYLSVPRDGNRSLLQLAKLFWREHLHAILRCLYVIRDYGDLFWDMILRAAGHSAAPTRSALLAARMAEERVKLAAIADPDMSAALLDVYVQLLSARSHLPLSWHVSDLWDFFSSELQSKRHRATTRQIHDRVYLLSSGRSALCVKVFPWSQVKDGRVLHEWQMLQRVASYPAHFVHLRGWTEFERRIAFITDHVPVQQRHFTPTSTHEALLYARSLLQVLATLHEEIAIIHGDIKPSNALWDGTELAVKLIDFGNAVDGPIHEGDVGGTDGFRAPESSHGATYATDIYSAGCTIAATLCTTPWSGHLQQQLLSCRSVHDMEQRLPLRTLPDRGEALATLLRLTLCLVALNPSVRPSARSAYSLLY